jgi:hypothetical protein
MPHQEKLFRNAMLLAAFIFVVYGKNSVAMTDNNNSAPDPRCTSLSENMRTLSFPRSDSSDSSQVSRNRFALIIGEAEYTDDLRPLPKAINDAQAMAERAAELGFRVTCVTNVTLDDFSPILSEYVDSLPEAGLVLFYFAGHGVAIDGQNYLLPVSLRKIRQALDVKNGGFPQSAVIDYLFSKNHQLLVFLDTCRTKISIPSSSRGPASDISGFVSSPSKRGLFSGYAAGIGGLAFEDTRNGWFTEMLSDELDKPYETIAQVLGRVSDRVSDKTHEEQVPRQESQGGIVDTILRLPRDEDETVTASIRRNKGDCYVLRSIKDSFAAERSKLNRPEIVEQQLAEALSQCGKVEVGSAGDTGNLFTMLSAYGAKLNASPKIGADAVNLPPQTLVANASGVRVRRSNDKQSPVLNLLPYGTAVQPLCNIRQCTDDWIAVRKGNKEGFVSAEFLERPNVVDTITFSTSHGAADLSIKDLDKLDDFVSRNKTIAKGFRVIVVASEDEGKDNTFPAIDNATIMKSMIASLDVDPSMILIETYIGSQVITSSSYEFIIQALSRGGYYDVLNVSPTGPNIIANTLIPEDVKPPIADVGKSIEHFGKSIGHYTAGRRG